MVFEMPRKKSRGIEEFLPTKIIRIEKAILYVFLVLFI